MAFADKLRQLGTLLKSIANIDDITRFEQSADQPNSVFYGREHVFNFSSPDAAALFVESINQKIDLLIKTEIQKIETEANKILTAP